MKKGKVAPVSTRALIQRINRKLAAQGEILKVTRGDKAMAELGQYFIVDIARNCMVRHDVDLEECGRKVEALAPWERLED